MNLGGDFELCCPVCRKDLAQSTAELVCRGCSRKFPVVAGIPDLRIFPDPYIGMEDDRKKGVMLEARAGQESFASLLDYYYSITSVVPKQHAELYKRGLLAGPARAAAALEVWEEGCGMARGGRLLEVGCGTGPLLLSAARRGYRVAGVDIALRWLIAAKKRLSEEGLNVPLVCACAEALPFRGEMFDRVVLDSAIEMVADQARSMREAHRVLAGDGRLFVATPNRFSLGPDPHIGVPAGGLWPKSWVAAVARRQGAIPPSRNLLWAKSLSRLIRGAGFDATRLELPRIADVQVNGLGAGMRAMVGLYRTARRIPVTRPGLMLVGPLLYATARKPRAAEHR